MEVLDLLSKTLSDDQIKLSQEHRTAYSSDWSKIGSYNPLCILFPKTEKDVINIILICNSKKYPVVISSGRTGLSGGAAVIGNEIVISLEKLNSNIKFDELNHTIICDAGFTTHQVQEFAAAHGYYYPVDFSSAGSSLIGGNIATNAGGVRVLKFGSTADYVLGLNVVLGSGKLIQNISNLKKTAIGPKLYKNFIGSEGLFGIITKCSMKVVDALPELETLLFGFDDNDSLEVIQNFLLKEDLYLMEYFDKNSLDYSLSFLDTPKPFTKAYEHYILIDCKKNALNKIMESDLLLSIDSMDIIHSNSLQKSNNLKKFRMHITESISQYSPIKFDISIPLQKCAKFLNAIQSSFCNSFLSKNYELIIFGHLGEGNFHVNIFGHDTNNKVGINEIVLNSVMKFSGSMSSEHGIGFLKKEYLEKSLSKDEITLLKELKTIYDPNNILNPYKFFS